MKKIILVSLLMVLIGSSRLWVLGATGSMEGPTQIGPMKENSSWDITLLAFVGMIALAWLIMQFLNINQQLEQITEIENEDAETQTLLLN